MIYHKIRFKKMSSNSWYEPRFDNYDVLMFSPIEPYFQVHIFVIVFLHLEWCRFGCNLSRSCMEMQCLMRFR